MQRSLVHGAIAAAVSAGLLFTTAAPANAHGTYEWPHQLRWREYYAPGGPNETIYSRCVVRTNFVKQQAGDVASLQLTATWPDNPILPSHCNFAPRDAWGSFVRIITYNADTKTLVDGPFTTFNRTQTVYPWPGGSYVEAKATGYTGQPVFGAHFRITNDWGVVWDWDVNVLS